MFRRNIEHFLKKRIYENLGIETKWLKNIFFLLIFKKIWTPNFTFYFWLINLWHKKWTYVLTIIRNLLYDGFWSREIQKIRFQIYILMKKVIILRKIQVKWRLSLHHFSNISVWAWTEANCPIMGAMRKKNIHTSAAVLLHIRIGNLDNANISKTKREKQIFFVV